MLCGWGGLDVGSLLSLIWLWQVVTLISRSKKTFKGASDGVDENQGSRSAHQDEIMCTSLQGGILEKSLQAKFSIFKYIYHASDPTCSSLDGVREQVSI